MYGDEEPYRVGVDDAEGPPVPMPNTEVKLVNAESTWLEAAWEDRTLLNKEAHHRDVMSFLYAENPRLDRGFR